MSSVAVAVHGGEGPQVPLGVGDGGGHDLRLHSDVRQFAQRVSFLVVVAATRRRAIFPIQIHLQLQIVHQLAHQWQLLITLLVVV